MLDWEKRLEDLEPKISAAVDAEVEARERVIELTVRLAGEETRGF